MDETVGLLRQARFHLPPFAFWSPEDWRTKGPECRDIVKQQLG
jgi:D-lyxose ketol-isomerase